MWGTKETVGPQVATKEEPILITRIAVPESNPDVIASVPVLEGEEMWAQEAIDNYDDGVDVDFDDEEILNTAKEAEKAAMHSWKAANPDSSLKHQRRLLELGRIDHLPWLDYLKAQPDEGYVQNAEQSSDTIWQRVKKAKNDE